MYNRQRDVAASMRSTRGSKGPQKAGPMDNFELSEAGGGGGKRATGKTVSASALSGAGGFLSLPRVGTCNCFNTCSCKDWACCCQCNDCKNDPAVAPHCQ